jgi:hypothetical protein
MIGANVEADFLYSCPIGYIDQINGGTEGCNTAQLTWISLVCSAGNGQFSSKESECARNARPFNYQCPDADEVVRGIVIDPAGTTDAAVGIVRSKDEKKGQKFDRANVFSSDVRCNQVPFPTPSPTLFPTKEPTTSFPSLSPSVSFSPSSSPEEATST